MDNTFKVGDTVIVHKPSNVQERPTWNEFMDCFDGNEYVILEVVMDSDGYYDVKLGDEKMIRWWFSTKWLERVPEPDDEELQSFINTFTK